VVAVLTVLSFLPETPAVQARRVKATMVALRLLIQLQSANARVAAAVVLAFLVRRALTRGPRDLAGLAVMVLRTR
jgi:hypothetical protein